MRSSNQVKMLGVIAVIVVMVMSWRAIVDTQTHLLSDAFFLAGILSLSAAGMRLVSKSGLFNLVAFSSQRILASVTDEPLQGDARAESFAQYVQRRHRTHDVRLLLVAGLLCLLASLLAAVM